MINKQKSHAFNKDIYLLGVDNEGKTLWLEAPKWDCGWYWAFGYVEQYRLNDIAMHTHWDSYIVGKDNARDGGYCHNPIESKNLKDTTFTEEEGWALAELFKRFYLLSDCAAMFGKGGAHVATLEGSEYLKLEAWAKQINEVLIPETTKRIIEILTPKN